MHDFHCALMQPESVVNGLSVCLSVRMATLPESPAAIDWSYYKTAVAKAGMVDDFEKKVSTSLTASLPKTAEHLFKIINTSSSLIVTSDCQAPVGSILKINILVQVDESCFMRKTTKLSADSGPELFLNLVLVLSLALFLTLVLVVSLVLVLSLVVVLFWSGVTLSDP